MKVVGFCGYSGSGKTTLVEQLVARLRLAGQRVSVVKHAHHSFDIDHPGKDSHRHRAAGAYEVVIASNRRLAKIREHEIDTELNVHQLIAELSPAADWVLVEGFKHADLLKIEVWRAETGQRVQYPNDPFVVAVATDSPAALPLPTQLPVLDLNDADAVTDWLLGQSERHVYRSPYRADNEAAYVEPAPKKAPLLSLDEALARLRAATTALAEVAPPLRLRRSPPGGDAGGPAEPDPRRLLAGLAIEVVSTFDGLGRVLAEPVRSQLAVPPHDNTSMDGYALRAADVTQPGVVLPVLQRVAAGQVGVVLEPGSAARIFTGAPIPEGADAVVMQEQCEATTLLDARPAVRVNAQPAVGQWIRRRGEDVRADSVVLEAGTRLTPQALGLAASVGAATLTVVRRPRVALFSTGDELVMPGEPLKPGAIYNSNRYTLRALLQQAGCEVGDLGIVPDRLDATRDALRRAAKDHDLILTSGGVSVGEEDHLRPAVQAEGAIDLWQIAIKPGKPLAFGHVRREGGSSALFIGLPGNPVSSFVTFLLAVVPVLHALQGMPAAEPAGVDLPAGFDWPKPDVRREFLRARRAADGTLELFGNQSSGVLTSAVWAEGVIDNPPGHPIARGDRVRFLPFAGWL